MIVPEEVKLCFPYLLNGSLWEKRKTDVNFTTENFDEAYAK